MCMVGIELGVISIEVKLYGNVPFNDSDKQGIERKMDSPKNNLLAYHTTAFKI